MLDVRLGFEVGSGIEVRIPVRHLAITGQTQEAGKTTALEALITRSGLRALTFITKRGEQSFTGAKRIAPYFREQADWQFVAAILEASRGERMKFERSWIIRASKGATTLAEVHANVKRLLDAAKRGMDADVYLTLDAYLEVVVPALKTVAWAPSVQLTPGVNVMDLTLVPDELQHLVIKSSIDWVLQKEQDTIVVIPEAWKFLPQGRGAPVKLAADALIRQGAGLRNYVWLDSQDIGGIEKSILRHVPVWILGVQRESNEIKRTLANIPKGIATPSQSHIATLELGQFIACWGKHAITTYAQPAWLQDLQARNVAMGDGSPIKPERRELPTPPQKPMEIVVNETEAQALRLENARLKSQNLDLHRCLAALERQAVARTVEPLPPGSIEPLPSHDAESMYQAFKARLMSDAPALIRLLVTKPEIEMTIERRTIQLDGKSLKGRIAALVKQGFFSEARTNNAVVKELSRTGKQVHPSNSLRELRELLTDGFLTDEASGYRAVDGMKVNIVEA